MNHLYIGKVKKKYQNIKHPIHLIKLEKDRRGLGISIAGHRDRNKMAVFVCGLNPNGPAIKTSQLKVGDEILEVQYFYMVSDEPSNQ